MELFRLVGSIFIDDSQAQDALDNTNEKVKDAGKNATKMSDKFKNAGAGMASTGAVITGAVGAVGAMMLNSAMDAESASAQIQASLGYTEEQANKLIETSKGIYQKGFGESLGQVTQEMIAVKQQMGDLNDADLGNVTQQAMSLAGVMGEDVGAVARSADMLMSQFGISSQEAFDLLATGYQKNLNYSGEMLDTINEYSVHFKEMGYTAEEAFAILVTGAENGAFNLDKVGDSVKENFLRLSDMGKGQEEVMEKLGISAEETMAKINAGGEGAKSAYTEVMTALAGVKDETERNRMGVELFGTQWEDVGQKVIMAMQPSVDVLGQVEGASTKAMEAMNGTTGQQALALWREFQTALEPLGQVLIQMAQDWLPEVSSAVKGLSEWFSNMSPSTQKLIVTLGLVAGAFGVLLLALAPIAMGIGALIPLFTAGGVAGGVFSAGLLPIVGTVLAVIAGIVALAGAIYLVIKNWDKIKDFFSNLWDDVKRMFKAFIDWAVNAFLNFTPLGLIISNWDKISDFFSELWDGVKKIFSEFIDFATDLFMKFTPLGILISNLEPIVDYISELWENIKSAFETGFQVITDTWSMLWDEIVQLTSTIMQNIGSDIDSGVQFIAGLWTTGIEELSTAWQTVWDTITSIVSTAYSIISEVVSDIVSGITGFIDEILAKASKVIALAQEAKEAVAELAGKGVEKAKEVGGKIKDGAKNLFQNAKEKFGFASGTDYFGGGYAIVGESGRELVELPRGSKINNNSTTEDILKGGGVTQHITINSPKALNPTETARKYKQASRQLALEWR